MHTVALLSPCSSAERRQSNSFVYFFSYSSFSYYVNTFHNFKLIANPNRLLFSLSKLEPCLHVECVEKLTRHLGGYPSQQNGCHGPCRDCSNPQFTPSLGAPNLFPKGYNKACQILSLYNWRTAHLSTPFSAVTHPGLTPTLHALFVTLLWGQLPKQASQILSHNSTQTLKKGGGGNWVDK